MRIAVTGGAGFIGSNLSAYLLDRGHEVLCLDNLSTGSKENIESLLGNPGYRLVEGDIRDRAGLEKAFKEWRPDTVYHYGAVVGVRRTLEHPEEVLNVNISGTVNVFEAALAAGCRKVVNISSSEVYGSPVEVPERETSPKNVELPYAIAKLVTEKYAKIYNDTHGLKTTSLRLFNVYGPRQEASPYGFVVGIFIRRVLDGQPPVIFGDGFQTRDFTYIEDCIVPTVVAGESDDANGEVFNIGAGKPVTLLDLAELVIELCGRDMEPVFEPEREEEIRHRFADISRMRTVLGYKPKYDLREGLKLTIDWYRQH